MQTNNNPRVALSKILVLAEYLQTRCGVPKFVANEISEIGQTAKAALAEPVKNCEVGTAEEQSARFDKFCHANINTQRCCGDCPAFRTTRDDCELVWAQMPYEEGEAK